VIVAPIVEEVMFRLFIFDALLLRSMRVRPWLALLAQALAFTWYDFDPEKGHGLFRALEIFVVGLILGIAYRRKGSLATVGIYAGLNLIITIAQIL